MATYFHGNPAYVQYTDTHPPPPPGNLVFLNSNSLSLQTQQFVGIPLPASSAAADHDPEASNDTSPLHGLVQRLHCNLYNPVDPSSAAHDNPRAQQGLSLSLSSQQQPGCGSQGPAVSGGSGTRCVLLSSQYLKAAQELLDEVVTVNNTGITNSELAKKGNGKNRGEPSTEAGDGSGGGEDGAKPAAALTTSERQEIQMKKAKLISMLDEVDLRYRQYHQQMQIVISSYEQVAGIGSAKAYTAVASKIISKQFRCLKDALSNQIEVANKSLGEGKIEGSRLKFVDHHLRQQRALQQLGMIQHNAWRPQRGLPEKSVSVLRAWLSQHFLHPYPKDSDKHMLAKQTGLARSQVSNWFINARVRLWKPMVEEMYMEEMKEHDQQNNEDSTSIATSPARSYNSKQDNNPTNQNASSMPISTTSTSPPMGNVRYQTGFSIIGSSELEEIRITQGSPKKPRNNELLHSPTNVQSINKDGYSFLGGFDQYPIGEIGRFDAEQFTPRFSGNGVSLNLGLPHCENLSLSATHQTFLSNQRLQMGRRLEIGEPNEFGSMNPSTIHPLAAFENISIQNRERFAAQLLPDFVA